uniref:Uncharacterized protein n=1 Tax=Panagrolaimus davidi TaxID=227884 RepID=A0A914QHN1_9BILA
MSSNDLPEIDEEFFEELEKLDFQEKQLKKDEKIIYEKKKKNKPLKKGSNLVEKEISDQDFTDPMETLDVQQRLNLAEKEIFRLKTKLRIKEDLIENLLRPIHEKILKKEKENGNLPKLLSEIKENISKALKRSTDIKEDISKVLNRSFSPSNEISRSNGSRSPTTPGEIWHLKKAIIEAQNKPERQKNVIVNFKQLSGDTVDSFINELIDFCEFNGITSFTPANQFHWRGKHHATLLMKFDSKDTAINVLQAATEIQKSAYCYRAICVRQDYSPTELKLLSLLWNEVNERNNKEGMFIWSVKNFRIVKSRHPGPWIYKPFNEYL